MRWFLVLALMLAACAADTDDTTSSSSGLAEPVADVSASSDGCADVVGVEVVEEDDGEFAFDVTVSSPDEGWDKYADEWVVRDLDGNILGTRTLTHPHVDEQPFTRSLTGVSIPDRIARVEVAARDSVKGYCGVVFEVDLP